MLNVEIFWNFDTEVQKNTFCFLSDFTWTFPKAVVSILYKKFNLFSPHRVLYNRKHFCSILTNLSNLSHNRWPFLFYQKFPLLSSDLKIVLTKHFPKFQLLANVLQNRLSNKFSDISKKMSVLESLFNKVTELMACNFI